MKIILKKVVDRCGFENVATAMSFANVCGFIADDVEKFVEAKVPDGATHLLMANHSVGKREWEIEEGRNPLFFAEESGNGWYVFTEEDVSYLFSESATSGSAIWAEKGNDGWWTMALEVPIDEDGKVYKGSYWKKFHESVGAIDVTPDVVLS